jgi:hypothetical protein
LHALRSAVATAVCRVWCRRTSGRLTAAALLGALLQPREIQYPLRVELPPYLQDYRATVVEHPAAQWAAGIYRLHRGRSAEVSPRSAAA